MPRQPRFKAFPICSSFLSHMDRRWCSPPIVGPLCTPIAGVFAGAEEYAVVGGHGVIGADGLARCELVQKCNAALMAKYALLSRDTIASCVGDPAPMCPDLVLGGFADASEGSQGPSLVRLHEFE